MNNKKQFKKTILFFFFLIINSFLTQEIFLQSSEFFEKAPESSVKLDENNSENISRFKIKNIIIGTTVLVLIGVSIYYIYNNNNFFLNEIAPPQNINEAILSKIDFNLIEKSKKILCLTLVDSDPNILNSIITYINRFLEEPSSKAGEIVLTNLIKIIKAGEISDENKRKIVIKILENLLCDFKKAVEEANN